MVFATASSLLVSLAGVTAMCNSRCSAKIEMLWCGREGDPSFASRLRYLADTLKAYIGPLNEISSDPSLYGLDILSFKTDYRRLCSSCMHSRLLHNIKLAYGL